MIFCSNSYFILEIFHAKTFKMRCTRSETWSLWLGARKIILFKHIHFYDNYGFRSELSGIQRLNKVLFKNCRYPIPGIPIRIIWIAIPKFGEFQKFLTGKLRTVTVRLDQDLVGPITSFPITNSRFFLSHQINNYNQAKNPVAYLRPLFP